MPAFLATMALVVGTESAASSALPSPEELPANVVAVVSHVPDDVGTITKAEFRRALVQGAAAEGRSSPPKPGAKAYEKLRDSAIGELLDVAWIKGQSAAMGIFASKRQIATELASIKKQNFKSEAQYREFLKRSHFTQRDVDLRVELQILSTRIEERVARGAKGRGEATKDFEEFVARYSKRWRARTVCTPEYTIDRCSNGPPPAS